ncbi:MAG TPA: hypothetical protein VGJ58_08725 [Gaiellaceae bacterium]
MQKNAEKIYCTYGDVIPLYDYTDEELELVLRFQDFSREWLESALAKMDELATRRRKPAIRAGRGARRSATTRRSPS